MTAQYTHEDHIRTYLMALQRDISERSKRFRTFSSQSEHCRYMALALCGEAGEYANLVKKEWRGDIKDFDTETRVAYERKVTDELSDIFVYWVLCCEAQGWTIEFVIQRAIAKAEEKIKSLEAARRNAPR